MVEALFDKVNKGTFWVIIRPPKKNLMYHPKLLWWDLCDGEIINNQYLTYLVIKINNVRKYELERDVLNNLCVTVLIIDGKPKT